LQVTAELPSVVAPTDPRPQTPTSPHQLDVLSLMVEGMNADQISSKLGMGVDDVNTCLYDVVEKLSKSERAQAALADLRKGMFKDVPGLTKWCPVCQRDLDPIFDTCPWDGAALDRASEERLIGQTFADRYEIIQLLGKGGMGIVYKARHKFMNRQVAIKILHPFLLADLNNMKRFRQEAEATSALQHPNVIQIFDFGLTTSGEAFLVMEFLEGTSLDILLDKVETLSVERAVDIFLQCCDALEHAHSHGIIHRDLKPSNVVLINQRGSSDFIKLVDFGIAKFTAPERNNNFTQDQTVRGSPGYMSPEQCQALKLDARSDIYSFGCVMYEALTGAPPFPADNAIDAMYMHCRTKPESICSLMPPGTIPQQLDEIILQSLAKDPAERQQTVGQLKRDLMRFRSAKSTV
jgi:serine/threonine protein kinase